MKMLIKKMVEYLNDLPVSSTWSLTKGKYFRDAQKSEATTTGVYYGVVRH